MDPADRIAATDAINEMRGLLGTVTIVLNPPNAVVLVDGEELKDGAVDKPIALGPGEHRIEARAEGYVAAEHTVTVVSGAAQEVTVDLALDPAARFANLGANSDVDAGPPSPAARQREPAPKRQGLYVLVLGSLLRPLTASSYLIEPDSLFGAAYGLRLGYQVNRAAGFEISYEHSSLFTSSTEDPTVSYRVISDRFGGALRLISPGKMFRILGAVGGGVVIDTMTFNYGGNPKSSGCSLQTNNWCPLNGNAPLGQPKTSNPGGVDAFFQLEAGVELDIDHVLVDVVAESQFQATGNFTSTPPTPDAPTGPVGIFGASPIINLGPALRIGYRFW
jgi:hypothetical protein